MNSSFFESSSENGVIYRSSYCFASWRSVHKIGIFCFVLIYGMYTYVFLMLEIEKLVIIDHICMAAHSCLFFCLFLSKSQSDSKAKESDEVYML